jgi:hypothetical protein
MHLYSREEVIRTLGHLTVSPPILDQLCDWQKSRGVKVGRDIFVKGDRSFRAVIPVVIGR